MPVYPQIWFPSGSPIGGDAQAGRGAFTKRHLHIDYIPLGDSGDPALTVSSNPQDIAGLDVPALKLEAGANSQGDAILIEKFSETGAFLTGEFQGADVFSVEGDGDIWNIGTMYAHKANVGGIAVAADGTTELDMTLGNLFTSTPSQNTVWSTASPVDATNGIGAQLATFIVDNAGGYTLSWGTGFTDVDAIGAGDTGISTRTLRFDGTTWHQIASTLDGDATNVIGGAGVFREVATGNIFGPTAAGRDATTGDHNFAAVEGAGDALTSGDDNVLIGENAGGALTTGLRNVFFGIGAGASETTGDDNFAAGSDALGLIVTGNDNFAVGPNAMGGYVDGNNNIAIGSAALFGDSSTTNGSNNIGLGFNVLFDITSGAWNIGMSQHALGNVTTGEYNIGIGTSTLFGITTGSDNIAIGESSGIQLQTSSDDCVCIGNSAGPLTGAVYSGLMWIDEHLTDTPTIAADFTNNRVGILVDPSALANILEVQASSATDPIADNWTTYPSDRNHKDIIAESSNLLESFRKIKTYKYKRKPLVSDLEVKHEAQKHIKKIIKDSGQRRLFDKTKIEDFVNENDLYEELKEAKSRLPKFTTERVGVSIDDPGMPDEILVKDSEGNITGIDLLGYAGYIHAVVKELAEKVAA